MGAVYVGSVSKYPDTFSFITTRDPFDDLVLYLEFLTARDSAAEFLRKIDPSESSIPERASAVSTHAKIARAFLDQARHSPEAVGFVSAYYAALNLAKIVILFSPSHAELTANRYHGVTYDPTRTPATLLDDTLRMKQGGTIPLFYRILTGETVSGPRDIQVRDVYCLISDVSSEWGIATGGASWLANLSFKSKSEDGGVRLFVEAESRLDDAPTVAQLEVLRSVEPVKGTPGTFRSVRAVDKEKVNDLFDEILDNRMLYYSHVGGATVPIGNLAGLRPVEEIPLILAFYHMSSVARYNPEFMESLRSSRYWPVAASLTTHGLYKFLLLTWSFVTQSHVVPIRT